jgi:hypothetical protein
MYHKRTHWSAYIAYFVLFGIVGGGFLALGLSPSGLAAVCIVFLMTVAPVACLICSVGIQVRRDRSRVESLAMGLGYFYSGLLGALWLIGSLFRA